MKAEDLDPVLKALCVLMRFEPEHYGHQDEIYNEVIREIGILQGKAELADKMAEHQPPLDLRTVADAPFHLPPLPGNPDGTGSPPPGMVEPSTTGRISDKDLCIHPGIFGGEYCPMCKIIT